MKTSCPECGAYPCESITHLDGSPGVEFIPPPELIERRVMLGEEVIFIYVTPEVHRKMDANRGDMKQ